MFFSRKFALGMFQRSVRNFCPKIARNEGKSVRKLNVRNFLQVSHIFTSKSGKEIKCCFDLWKSNVIQK